MLWFSLNWMMLFGVHVDIYELYVLKSRAVYLPTDPQNLWYSWL